MNESAQSRFWEVLKVLICLGLIGGSVYFLSWLFTPSPPKQTHQEIALSNGGIINIDCTWHPENDFVNKNVTYKPPGGKPEFFCGGNSSGPLEASEVSSYITGSLVVVTIGETIKVRTKEGVWKDFGTELDFPSTNDFSAEDIQLMGITSQRSLRVQDTGVSTLVDHYDPQTRIFSITYQNPSEHLLKSLRLQLSEDGTRLKVLNINRVKN